MASMLLSAHLATFPTDQKVTCDQIIHCQQRKDPLQLWQLPLRLSEDRGGHQHYKIAISLAPDHAVSHNNLGTLLELEEVEFHYWEAVHHNPQHHRTFNNLGQNLETRGRMAEEEAAYRESININPAYSDALMGIAMAMAESGRVEEGHRSMWKLRENAWDIPLYEEVEAYTRQRPVLIFGALGDEVTTSPWRASRPSSTPAPLTQWRALLGSPSHG